MKRLTFAGSGLLMTLIVLSGSPAKAAEEFVFSAPPRGPAAKESKVYQPIAEYLSQATGKKITYRHPGNWLSYQADMQKGNYDLVFDGPHFVSWRMAKTDHVPLVRLPGQLAFSIVVAAGNNTINDYKDLRGRTVCGLAPPNLATLTLYSLFPNPARQPLVVEAKSFPQAYEAVKSGKCVAAVMRDKMFYKLNREKKAARAIFQSRGIANQAFSAGPRFTVSDKNRMISALLSQEGKNRITAFHQRFNKQGKPLRRARSEEYAGLAVLLKDVWGFSLAMVQPENW